MSAADIPALVKHMALAIYESGWAGVPAKKPGPAQTRAITACLDAARWRLVEYGFLRSGSQHGPVSNIALTAKGRERNAFHKRESEFARKEKKFGELYALIAEEAENPIGDSAVDVDNTAVSAADRDDVYTTQQQLRRADVAAKQPPPQPSRKSNLIKKARTRRVRRRW